MTSLAGSPHAVRVPAIDVVTLGENSVDLMAQLPRDSTAGGKRALIGLQRLTGGQAATAAIGCARLGCRTRYIGRVGDDEAGAAVRTALASEGVELALETVPGVATRTAIILVDPDGGRDVLEFRDPALNRPAGAVADDDDLLRLVSDARLLLVDATDPSTAERAARLARAAGIATMVDVDRPGPDTDALLAQIDLLVVSEAFAQAVVSGRGVGEGLAALEARFGPALAIATLGEDGALVRQGSHEWRVPGFDVAVKDTTGAGDAFRAGLAAAWLRRGPGAELTALVTWANAAAALNCREVGAQAGLPTVAEVDALVTLGRARQSK